MNKEQIIKNIGKEDYEKGIKILKTWDEWKKIGWTIYKGEKCVSKNENGQALFCSLQVIPEGSMLTPIGSDMRHSERKNDYKHRKNPGDDWDDYEPSEADFLNR